jgi:hypothetical protein
MIRMSAYMQTNRSLKVSRNKFTELSTSENDIKTVNLLCTLSILSSWPRVLFEIIVEYYQAINTCYIFGGIGGIGGGGTANSIAGNTTPSNCGKLVNDVWYELPRMITCRFGHATSRVDEYINVIGGTTGLATGPRFAKVDQFHIPTSTWSIGPALPEPRAYHGCISVDNDLYCIGGID